LKSFWYSSELKEKAKYLRRNSTLSEIILWKELKRKQINGFDFDRQIPINYSIVDFFCKDLKLAIEIDGSSHDGKLDYDIKRENKLNSLGIFILRFSNEDILYNMDKVTSKIKKVIREAITLTPNNSPLGRGSKLDA